MTKEYDKWRAVYAERCTCGSEESIRKPTIDKVRRRMLILLYTLSGFAYLTSVMDLFSRKIIGWHVSDTLSTEHVLKAIGKAKINRKASQPVVIHSDRGSQYVSKRYLEATPAAYFIHSYSNKGNPWDNACIEAFHALIKREWLNRYVIKNTGHAHKLVFEYIETFYNTVRIHEHCGMMSPYDFENTLVC